MWEYIIAIGIVVLVIGIYIFSFIWNDKTKKPEDCEDVECNSCKAVNCSHRK